MFDCSEARKWLKQAYYTRDSVKADLEAGYYSWACFKSNQAAEYALKAIIRGVGYPSFGHDLLALWRKAVEVCSPLQELYECIILLNKMYIPPRYPDAWAGESPPYENYSRRDAEESQRCAEQVLEAVSGCVNEACENTG